MVESTIVIKSVRLRHQRVC